MDESVEVSVFLLFPQPVCGMVFLVVCVTFFFLFLRE